MKYSFPGTIRYSEVDEDAYLTLPALINYLQDCAVFHGEAGGVGLEWIAENGLTWLLTSSRFHIYRYPKFAEQIITSTWATGFRSYVGYRDFRMETPDGEIIAEGKSDWVFMDMKAYRPVPVPQVQLDGYGIEPQFALEEKFGKRKIAVPEEGEKMEPFEILESHLDTNRHVNNAQYIRMAQNYLRGSARPEKLRCAYKNQALLGDMIYPVVTREENTDIVQLLGKDGEAYFIGTFSVCE